MVPRVPSPPKKHTQSESSVTYILSLSLPRNNKISLQVLFLPHQFYVLLLFYIHYIVFVWSNVDELSQYKKKLECSIPIDNLVPTKYFISQKVYACFIILPLLLEIICCSHNNQESKQRCSNISYNKFNAGPKQKIISYMSLILFITQSHSSMAHHQRIIDYRDVHVLKVWNIIIIIISPTIIVSPQPQE